jgi:predicted unusual protein kinase regulating ubiquinone biosynthesis (AarF/ABC1/UbiB family)
MFFSKFDPTPIAVGSIAQIYRAKLKDETKVAVKIQKPDVRKEFESDFKAIIYAAIFFDFFNFFSNFYLEEIVCEFISWTRRELDFTFETKNAMAVYKHSLAHARTVVPKQYPEFSTPRMLVQELIELEEGVAVEDLFFKNYSFNYLSENGINPDEMANYIVADQMRQYFIDGFFHADPHPANLIFLTGNKLVYIDFGIVGKADAKRLLFLKTLYGIAKKDIDAAARAMMEFGSKTMAEELDIYFKRNIRKHQLTLKIMEKIKETILADFKKDLGAILNPWFEALKKPDITLAEKGATSVFLATIKEAERHSARFPREMILFFRSLSLLDIMALHISPNFDMMKALNYFFDKNPIEEVERIISEESHIDESERKMIYTADIDWESFREIAVFEKERTMHAQERIMELITHYAERYEELRPLMKNYK